MKIWVLVVAALNILLFFWELHNGAFKPQPVEPNNLPSILLLDEAERAQRGAVISGYIDQDAQELAVLNGDSTVEKLLDRATSVKSKLAAVELQTQVCYEFGPFSNNKAATAWLAGQGLSGLLFHKSQLVPSTYLLYAPLDKDPEKRRSYKRFLIEKGIEDFFIFANGELKGQMSFGIFNELSRASRYQQELATRGVQVQIKERFRERSSLFVGFSRGQGGGKIAAGVVEVGCK